MALNGNLWNLKTHGTICNFSVHEARVNVECPKTGHLRSCTREYFEYQLWNIYGIRIEKGFYFFIILVKKWNLYKFLKRKVSLTPLVTYKWGAFWHGKYYELHHIKAKAPKPTISKTLEELAWNPLIDSSNLAHDWSLGRFWVQ
jgi:hypothetical protein